MRGLDELGNVRGLMSFRVYQFQSERAAGLITPRPNEALYALEGLTKPYRKALKAL